jgi:hypothetical protein
MTGWRFVLHKHCPAWDFQLRCRGLAIERDDLSLGAITAKERVKFEEKGISTITQCSARAIAVSSISLGADFALGDESGERDGVVLAIFLEPHGLQIPGLKPVENEYSCSHPATSYFIISVILA